MTQLKQHLRRHGRFYAAFVLGVAVWFAASPLKDAPRVAAAGDVFFIVYLLSAIYDGWSLSPEKLRKRAEIEDEGILLIILIAIGAVGISSFAIFTILGQKHGQQPVSLIFAVAGIPLGWSTLHTIAAFHYADLYYARKGQGPHSVRGLEFPDTKEPGIWEFLYYAFTIGTTAQTSDTDLRDTQMRKATLGHSVVAFFYNTAIIAMAINAVVSIAS